MNRPLPNITAEAVGFTIPSRSSSLQPHSKQSFNQKKTTRMKKERRSSLAWSHDEVADRMKSLSLGSLEINLRKSSLFDSSFLTHRQILKRATSLMASRTCSSPPISVYRNCSRPSSQHTGDLSRQASLKIKTFRATDIPDPQSSPDLSAHPANTLPGSPGSPVSPMSGSPITYSFDKHPFNIPPRLQTEDTSESPTDSKTKLYLPLLENTTTTTKQAPDVTKDTTDQNTEKTTVRRVSRDTSDRHHYSYDYNHHQSTKSTAFASTQHFATDLEGKVIKIPGALSESLASFKECVPRQSCSGMGWE